MFIIQICKDLLEEGALLTIHDPKVEKNKISKDAPIKVSLNTNKNKK